MTAKPVVFRGPSDRDVTAVVDWWTDQGRPDTALAFVAAVEEAYAHIGRFLGTGSTRLGLRLRIKNLRTWRIKGFSHVVVYRDEPDWVIVERVLDGRRDLEALLDPDDDPLHAPDDG
jgi:toxin ParE1/3/4